MLAERYVLGDKIGAGATALVYEAFDTVLQREVAVKLFRGSQWELEPGRFEQEVRMLATLVHPHLVPLYDAGGVGDDYFIVMPLVRGSTLAGMIRRGPVEPAKVRLVGKALADALTHVHAHGVIHRDVKPSNVLIGDDGSCYLADFGFAHSVDGPALTATNCIVGTAGYLAPEQAMGHSASPASDVYALGLVLVEALTGQRQYGGTPIERMAANALRGPSIPDSLPPEWHSMLTAMTAQDPEARPPMTHVWAQLAEIGEAPLHVPSVHSGVSATANLASAASVATDPIGDPAVASARTPVRSRPAWRSDHRRTAAASAVLAFLALGTVAATQWPASDSAAPVKAGTHQDPSTRTSRPASAPGSTSGAASGSTSGSAPTGNSTSGSVSTSGSASTAGSATATQPSSSSVGGTTQSSPPPAVASGPGSTLAGTTSQVVPPTTGPPSPTCTAKHPNKGKGNCHTGP